MLDVMGHFFCCKKKKEKMEELVGGGFVIDGATPSSLVNDHPHLIHDIDPI